MRTASAEHCHENSVFFFLQNSCIYIKKVNISNQLTQWNLKYIIEKNAYLYILYNYSFIFKMSKFWTR